MTWDKVECQNWKCVAFVVCKRKQIFVLGNGLPEDIERQKMRNTYEEPKKQKKKEQKHVKRRTLAYNRPLRRRQKKKKEIEANAT